VEIEIDRRLFYSSLVALGLLALVGLALLGRAYTPDPPRLVGWADWKALEVERRYQGELAQLRQDLAELADLLQSNPNPVQAEMAASRLAQRHGTGLGLLVRQREAVVAAAETVRDWAAGFVTYEDAVATVDAAIEIVGEETPDDDRPRVDDEEWRTEDYR
jgi:hypothetical protein